MTINRETSYTSGAAAPGSVIPGVAAPGSATPGAAAPGTFDPGTADPCRALDWRIPPGARNVSVVDAHTAGEPLRVIVDGYPIPVGPTLLDRRRDARERLDGWRRLLMLEPRGHADMYGCLIMDPVTDTADFSVLFLHNEGYSTMCGHGIIAVATVVLETGMIPAQEPVTTIRIDTPAGLVTARAHLTGDRVERVDFLNVPSFVVELDAVVDVPGIGEVRYDLAFGGAYYAYVSASDVDLRCRPEEFRTLIDVGMRIKRAISSTRDINHPAGTDLGFLYGTIFLANSDEEGVHSRSVCVFADGQVDRSPTGTGVSGRAAIQIERGDIKVGEAITIESLIGTRFDVTAMEEVYYSGNRGIIPCVSGEAFITGRTTFVLDPNDPLTEGFLLR